MVPPQPATSPLLAVDNLTTVFDSSTGPVRAVDEVSFQLGAGETLCLVGESGSGKSVTALSIMRLVQPPGRIVGGRILFKGRDLLKISEREMQAVRGADIALVFQEPMSALDPVFTIGDQIVETLRVHGRATRREAKTKAAELLEAVRIANPIARLRDYPHQLSGGMRQRVLLALALACRPAVLLADEPTTALDVTVQAEILDLLREMRRTLDLAILLVTHDLGVVGEIADRVAVMYAGRIVEEGPVRAVLHNPQHPYTRGLLASIPGKPPQRGLRVGDAGKRGGRRLRAIEGTVSPHGARPPGCAFNPRCPDRLERCTSAPPPEYPVGPGHGTRCYLYSEGAPLSGVAGRSDR